MPTNEEIPVASFVVFPVAQRVDIPVAHLLDVIENENTSEAGEDTRFDKVTLAESHMDFAEFLNNKTRHGWDLFTIDFPDRGHVSQSSTVLRSTICVFRRPLND